MGGPAFVDDKLMASPGSIMEESQGYQSSSQNRQEDKSPEIIINAADSSASISLAKDTKDDHHSPGLKPDQKLIFKPQ